MSSTKRMTPAGDREDRKAEAAMLLGYARREAGLTASKLAAEAGVSRTLVRAWEDEEDPDHPVPLDAVFVPELQRAMVRALAARAGLVVAEIPQIGGAHDDVRLVADVQRETTEAVSAFLDAISDGVVTRAENERVRREAREAVEALTRLIVTIEATAHEPVVGIRRSVG